MLQRVWQSVVERCHVNKNAADQNAKGVHEKLHEPRQAKQEVRLQNKTKMAPQSRRHFRLLSSHFISATPNGKFDPVKALRCTAHTLSSFDFVFNSINA